MQIKSKILTLNRRYLAVVLNGMKNPLRNVVSKDITGAILKTPATGGKNSQPATYWSHEEQKVNVEEVYQKYLKIGGVWSAAAADVSDIFSSEMQT